MYHQLKSSLHQSHKVIMAEILTPNLDGQQVDLSQFSLSSPDLERKRVHIRTVIMEQEMANFAKTSLTSQLSNVMES